MVNEKQSLINDKQLLVLDIETTGLNPSIDKIVEIGIVFLDLNFDTIAPMFNAVLNNAADSITGQEWVFKNTSLSMLEVVWSPFSLSDVKFFIERLKLPWVSYNTLFDFTFLAENNIRVNNILQDPMIILSDIMKLPRKNGLKGYKWPKVVEAAKFLGIDEIEQHRALQDAIFEAKIILEMYKRNMYILEVKVNG